MFTNFLHSTHVAFIPPLAVKWILSELTFTIGLTNPGTRNAITSATKMHQNSTINASPVDSRLPVKTNKQTLGYDVQTGGE